MNKLIMGALLSVMLAAIVACSQHPAGKPANTNLTDNQDYETKIINQPFQKVWDNLVQYLETKQIQIKIRKEESGFIDTGYMSLQGRDLSVYAWTQGNRPSQMQSRGRIKASIYLWKISADQTLVTMNTQVEVYENPTRYSNGGWLYANSTGKFEAEVLSGFLRNQELAETSNQ